jgi:hypothetical protein
MRGLFLLPFCAAICFAQVPSVDDLIRKLGDDDFDVREQATRALEERGEAARAALTKAAKEAPDIEVRIRAKRILADLERRAEERALAEKLQALKNLTTPTFDPKSIKPLVEKRGDLTGREVWTADSSYRIAADLTLSPGANLTIEPGTVIVVAAGVNLRGTKGATLTARGEPGKPIVFTSEAETRGKSGHWGELRTAGMNATLRHVQIRRSSGVCLDPGSNVTVEGLGIFHTRGDALLLDSCSPTVNGLVVREATGCALVVSNSNAVVIGAILSRCDVGVAYTENSHGTLSDVALKDIQAEAIRATASSSPNIQKALVMNAGFGLNVNGASSPTVTGTILEGLREDGIVVEGGSYPQLLDVKVTRAAGWGLSVKSGSYPVVGLLDTTDCKKGNQLIEPNCDVLTPDDYRRIRSGRIIIR